MLVFNSGTEQASLTELLLICFTLSNNGSDPGLCFVFWLCLDAAGIVQCSHVALSACNVLSWHAIIALCVQRFHFALLLLFTLLLTSMLPSGTISCVSQTSAVD